MRIKVSGEAAQEILDAAAWYEERRAGLGAQFKEACDCAFEHIAKNPAGHLHVGKGFHRYLMSRFPFVVFYETRGEVLIVAAVIHGARNPLHWRQRLGLE